jgi:hypothetical protein
VRRTDVHRKGHTQQLPVGRGPRWDHEIADEVMRAYGISGDYWYGTVRLTVPDLFAGGLLDEVETTVDPATSRGEEKLLFKLGPDDLGHDRMRQSGLLAAQRGAQP